MNRAPVPPRRGPRFAALLFTAGGLAPFPAAPLPAAETVLVQLGSAMKYHLPASGVLGITWTERSFGEAGFLNGTYGVGYAAGGMIKTTVAVDTRSVYTRAHFAITDLAQVESVWLGVDYDDGYVAYVNGKEVARAHMPSGAPAFDTVASTHESSNGTVPNYDPLLDITTLANPVLVEGDNVLAIGVWNTTLPSGDLALAPYLSINRPVVPPGEVHWTLAGSPYLVNTTLTIPRGTVLRVDPGVTARFAAGVRLEIQGQILAEGTAESPITFDRSGTSGSWSGIDINHGGDGVVRPSTIRFATIQNASTLVNIDGTGDSEITIEDCVMDHWTSLALHWDNGANRLRVSRSRLGLNTPPSEQSHEAVNGYRSSAILEYCTFGPRLGYNDTIDLGDTKWGGPVPTVRYNEVGPGQDDGIDFDNCDGYIIGNFVHGRRPPADGPKETGCPQYPIGGGGMNGGGLTGNEGSRPFVINNIVYDCYHGIGYKNGAQPTLINNTIVGCTWGIILFRESDISNPALAHGTLVNDLIWDCQVAIKLSWCDADPKSIADATYCYLAGGWPGAGNVDASESPLAGTPDRANPQREQFRLKACSKAVDAAFAGQVTQTFHAEAVPESDSEGSARADMVSVSNAGGGSPSYYDIGAFEYSGPDQCSPPPPGTFVRGDANGDAVIDVSDPIRLLFSLFGGMGTDCQDALDANDDGLLGTADAVRVLEYLFRQGPALPPPFPTAGTDPTDGDALGCGRG